MIQATIKRIDRHQKVFEEISKRVNNGVEKAVKLLETEIKESLRVAYIPGLKTTYRTKTGSYTIDDGASKSPEPPRLRTGKLLRSVSVRSGKGEGVLKVSAPYAKHLEFGTWDKTLEARPFVRPAVRRWRKKLRRELSKLKR